MLDDTSRSWWYEQDGQQAGPATAAAIARLVAEGKLGPAHRVWRDGMAGWEPLGSVPELAPALEAARPPPGPPPLSAPPPGPGRPPVPPSPFGQPGPWAPPAGVVAAPALEPVSVSAVVLLSIVTFGIYGLVKFHQTGKAYEALAGRASHFSRDFWLFVGLGVASFVLHQAAFLGIPLAIASLVFQVLTLNEALALRAEGVRRAGTRPELTPDGTHRALFISGILLSWLLVGLVLLLVQAAKWFSDWNAFVAAAGPSARPAAGLQGR